MIRLLPAILAAVLLLGCAERTTKPVDQDVFAKTDDVPPGPGLFTGKDGAFIIGR